MALHSTRAQLRMEPLELRALPALFGMAWPQPDQLTLAFATDGTPIGSTVSSAATLGATHPGWQHDALRAVQKWVAAAEVSVGWRADSSTPFGQPSLVNSLRVGVAPLSEHELATTTPFDGLGAGVGEVVLNAAAFPAGGPDLFTALLQETGHALGVPNSSHAADAMYTTYQQPRTELSAGDVAAVRAIYGARQPDSYEGSSGNDNTTTATLLGTQPLEADLTTPSDIDVYRVTVPAGQTSLTAALRTSGFSLLTADLSLWTTSGVKLAGTFATNPRTGDLSITAGGVAAGQTMYLRVAANTQTPFTVGRYRLAVGPNASAGLAEWKAPVPLRDAGTNETPATATNLGSLTRAAGGRFEAVIGAAIDTNTDVDVYRFQPAVTGPIMVTVQTGGFTPEVRVLNAAGQPLPAEVLAQEPGTTTLQLRSAAAGAELFVEVRGNGMTTGEYRLAVDLRTTPVDVPTAATGGLTNSQPQVGHPFTTTGARRHQFAIEVAGPAGTAARVTIYDANGAVVDTVMAEAGRTSTLSVRLAAGNYMAKVAGGRRTGGAFSLNYTVRTFFRDDPIGPILVNPIVTDNPAGTPIKPGQVWPHFDVYSDPWLGI